MSQMVDESTLFRPLPWQIEPWEDTSPIILLTGSAGGGKSRLAAEKIHAVCCRYAGAQGLIVRKTRESLINSTLAFMEHTVIGKSPLVKHSVTKKRFEYWNGSILAYGGMKDEDQREQIRSIGTKGGLDICWMEEANAFTEDDFNEILARMRGKATGWPQIILTTNPDSPYHWIKRRLIDGGEAKVYYSCAEDNPHNPKSYLEALNSLTGIMRARLRDGLWVQAEGIIYTEWDPDKHIIKSFKIPKTWTRIRVIDFGYTAPFTCQWWAIDENNTAYLYREVYGINRIVQDWAKIIKQYSGSENIKTTICDWDAEDRATLLKENIITSPADKRIRVGIEAVKAMLRGKDGVPKLYVFEDSLVEVDKTLKRKHLPTRLVEEIPGYVWRGDKEEPLKVNDHGCDCMRYMALYVSRMSKRLFLW